MIERREPAAGVTELRLDRPPVNALNPELLAALQAALAESIEGGARAVVVSGCPGMFSAGLDIPHLLTLDEAGMAAFWESLFGLLARLARCPVPVGFAVTGHCPAGGTVLALFGDYRIAADGEFRLGLNETRVGLPVPPVVFGAYRRLLGPRMAEQLGVAGRLVTPKEALAAGLVDEVVPPDAVVARAVERAAELASLPRHAVAATRIEARADLVGLFEGIGGADYEQMTAAWFAPETQAELEKFQERLAARKKPAST